ncbi:hypothetical protein OQA88_5886 [Cercophora sp. LCS_1]
MNRHSCYTSPCLPGFPLYHHAFHSMQPTLYRLTEDCLNLFSRCLRVPGSSAESLAWLETSKVRFRLWAFALNVQKSGRSSLDTKLSHHDDIRKVLSNLLLALAATLSEFLSTAKNGTRYFFNDQDEVLSDSSSSALSESSSDAGIDIPTPGRRSRRHQAQRRNIDACLRHLSRLSILIRRSGDKFRHKRADDDLKRAEQSTATTYPELRSHLEAIIAFGTCEFSLLCYLDRAVDVDCIPGTVRIVVRAWLFSRLGTIQQRLIQANVIRRHRIIFSRSKRRSDSLKVTEVKPDRGVVNTPIQALIQAATSRPAQPLAKTAGLSVPPSRSKHQESEVSTVTAIGENINLTAAMRSTKASSTMSKLTRTGQAQDYPKRTILDPESCQCPYCGVTLEQEYLDHDKKWQGHVAHDLAPYTCIFEDCESPFALYVTREQWTEHARKSHSISRWLCSRCSFDSPDEVSASFTTEADCKTHMIDNHGDLFSPEDIPFLLQLSKRSVITPVSCPLCLCDWNKVDVEEDDHIAAHLHAFSLLALPWDHDLDDAAVSASPRDPPDPPTSPRLPDDPEDPDDNQEIHASGFRDYIIGLGHSLKNLNKGSGLGPETGEVWVSQLGNLLETAILWASPTQNKISRFSSLASRIVRNLELLHDGQLLDPSSAGDLKLSIMHDLSDLEDCMHEYRLEDYEIWKNAARTLPKNIENVLEGMASRSEFSSRSLPNTIENILKLGWALQTKCSISGSSTDLEAANDIVDSLQEIADDEAVFSWPPSDQPWLAIAALISDLKAHLDKPHTPKDRPLKIPTTFWLLQFVLRSMNFGRIYGQAYTINASSEDAFAALRFSIQDLYANILELLAQMATQTTENEARKLSREIRHPSLATGVVQKLRVILIKLEADVIKCKRAQTGVFDEYTRRQLDNTPLLTLHFQPSHFSVPPTDADTTNDNTENENRDNELLDWLSSLPYRRYHQKIRKARVANTCDWLIEHDAFKRWTGDNRSILWLYGSFGTGKTYLTSKVIDHLAVATESDETSALAYLYLGSIKSPSTQPVTTILRGLLCQLAGSVHGDDIVLESLRGEWKKFRMRASEPNLATCIGWFSEAVNLRDLTTLVLDGVEKLDIPVAQSLLLSLQDIVDHSSSRLRVFVSCSWPSIAIQASHWSPQHTITLQHWYEDGPYPKVHSDMIKVLSVEVGARLDTQLIRRIADQSEGSFFWAISQIRLHFDHDEYLKENSEPENLGLPAAFVEAHKAMKFTLERQGSTHVEIYRLIFMLVSFAARPLIHEELLSAMRFGLKWVDPSLCEEYLIRMIKVLPDLLFLDLHLEGGFVWKPSHRDIVPCLEKATLGWTSWEGNEELLLVCLRAMTVVSPNSRGPNNPITNADIFQDYACHHWATHALSLESTSTTGHGLSYEGTRLLRQFFGSPSEQSITYQTWIKTLLASDENEWPPTADFTPDGLKYLANKPPIALMCQISLFNFLLRWLDDPEVSLILHSDLIFDVGAFDLPHGTMANTIPIATKLIELGVDVNQPLSDTRGSLLLRAARSGSVEWVELLLEKGADLKLLDLEQVCPALEDVVSHRETRIVSLLLSAGMPPDRDPSGLGTTSALAGAAIVGDVEIATMLLDAGADVNRPLSPSARFGGALAAAASDAKSSQVLELLIEHGADVNAQGGNNGSPLGEAAAANNIDALEMLIAQGADITMQFSTGGFGNALETAAHHDSTMCLRALLQQGADLHYTSLNSVYGNALAAASNSGALECLSELIQAGADVNQPIPGGKFGSSLAAAAAGGDLDSLKMLIEAGAEVQRDLPIGWFGNALIAASYGKNPDCITCLLDHGADVNATASTGYYGTPLLAAVLTRDVESVRPLVEEGADLDLCLPVGKYGSALAAAASMDSLDMVEALIQAGANVNLVHTTPTARYGSPLICAAAFGSTKCLQALLKAGADVDMEVEIGLYGTALIAATGEGGRSFTASVACLESLVKAGADVNRQARTQPGRRFKTALIAAGYLGRAHAAKYLLSVGALPGLEFEDSQFVDALEAARTPVSEEDFNLFKLFLKGMMFDLSKGLVQDKEEIVKMLERAGGG